MRSFYCFYFDRVAQKTSVISKPRGIPFKHVFWKWYLRIIFASSTGNMHNEAQMIVMRSTSGTSSDIGFFSVVIYINSVLSPQ